MKKDALLFNRPMLEALMDLLPDEAEDVRRLIEAAISFGLGGEEVDDVPRSVRAAWRFFKDNIQRDDERYSRICKQNRRNGAKGGRPRKNRETESVSDENPKNRTVISETERFSEKPNGFLENPKNPITITNTITNTNTNTMTHTSVCHNACADAHAHTHTRTSDDNKSDAFNYDSILGHDLAESFRGWLEIWQDMHGKGRAMNWAMQQAQLKALMDIPEDVRGLSLKEAIKGGWKAIHDIREFNRGSASQPDGLDRRDYSGF